MNSSAPTNPPPHGQPAVALPPTAGSGPASEQEQTERTEAASCSVSSVASCSKSTRSRAPLPSRDQRTALRAEQLIAYRTRLVPGLSPAEASAELGLNVLYLQRLDRRERQHGPAALRPGFTTRKPRQEQTPITIVAHSLLRRRPRRPSERRAFDLNARLVDLGRYLQLRSQGHSLSSSARQMGRAASYLWGLDRDFRRAGLFGVARIDRQLVVHSAPGFEIVANVRAFPQGRGRPPGKEAA